MKTCQISSKLIQKEIQNFKDKKYILLKTSPFQQINLKKSEELQLIGDNTKKSLIFHNFSKEFIFFGHYRNLLTLYQSLKNKLDESIPVVDPQKILDSYINIVNFQICLF